MLISRGNTDKGLGEGQGSTLKSQFLQEGHCVLELIQGPGKHSGECQDKSGNVFGCDSQTPEKIDFWLKVSVGIQPKYHGALSNDLLKIFVGKGEVLEELNLCLDVFHGRVKGVRVFEN